ncbi:hypothetical protein BJY00DRAFT_20489 [Aspergillus carlsbadensis]|nr:hypothetical protein BJY00DRAFT_20489 [Aspergillus carlsbadensis]
MLNATAQGNIMHTGNVTKLAKYKCKNKQYANRGMMCKRWGEWENKKVRKTKYTCGQHRKCQRSDKKHITSNRDREGMNEKKRRTICHEKRRAQKRTETTSTRFPRSSQREVRKRI